MNWPCNGRVARHWNCLLLINMNRILQSPLTVIVAAGLMFFLTLFLTLSFTHLGTVNPAGKEPQSANDDPSWKFTNPEMEQWIASLKEERDALAVKEQELKDWETRLTVESHEIDSITQTVSRAQAEYDQRVLMFKEQEKDNLKKQLKVVSEMSPGGAALMLGEMSDNDVTKLLYSMKPDISGPILDAMSKTGQPQAKRAATLAQRLKDVLPIAATNLTPNASP